ATMASSALQWELIKGTSCFLVKRGRKQFSTEPGNLKSRNCFNSNGLIHRKTVGIEPGASGSGVTLVLRNSKRVNKPSRGYSRIAIKKQGPRPTLNTVKRILRQRRYRRDLELAALRRASALLRSQGRKVGK
ncbi:hypothetical protein BOX15_Mlig017654g3, partial [Macrostomum lignano]